MSVPAPHESITRRAAVRRISSMLGGALSAPTLAGLLAGCEAPGSRSDYAPRTFTPAQMRRVDIIAEMIIPTTDTPGASAARVHHFIDTMLTDFFEAPARADFLDGLERVDAVSVALNGTSFETASEAERVAVLSALDREAYPDELGADAGAEPRPSDATAGRETPPFMRTMKELTVAGYYTSEIGQTVELHQAPFGAFAADVPLSDLGRTWA